MLRTGCIVHKCGGSEGFNKTVLVNDLDNGLSIQTG